MTDERLREALDDREVEMIYAAYETVMGWEARTTEGRRGIVQPIYEAVIGARVDRACRSESDIVDDLLDETFRAAEEAATDRGRELLGGALETIRRYNVGEITERQACDWFHVDRLALRTALAATPEPTLDAAWAEAEAALPENGLWLIEGVQLVDTSDSDDLNDEQLEWEAEAVDHRRGGQPTNITALGPTPAAALNALHARLSSEPRQE